MQWLTNGEYEHRHIINKYTKYRDKCIKKRVLGLGARFLLSTGSFFRLLYNEVMNQISLDITRYTTPQTTARSERQEANEYFFEMIDKESAEQNWRFFDKKEKKWKKIHPVNRARQAIRLNTIFKDLDELRDFYKECLRYKRKHGSFSRRYWGGFNKQKWQ